MKIRLYIKKVDPKVLCPTFGVHFISFSSQPWCQSTMARVAGGSFLLLEQIADVSEQLFLGGTSGSLGLFLLGHELVHGLDHQEDAEGDDQEVDNVLEEQTVLEGVLAASATASTAPSAPTADAASPTISDTGGR